MAQMIMAGTALKNGISVPMEKECWPSSLRGLFPVRLLDAMSACRVEGRPLCPSDVEEIRLRAGRSVSLTVRGGNCMVPVSLDRGELWNMLVRMCGGSLYAYSHQINQGFLTLPGGVRVGVAGRAAVENGCVIGVRDITGLCIRIPHRHTRCGQEICRLLRSFSMTRGVLIYAPPGVGKTTLLRGVAAELAGGTPPLRTVVIDTRGELSFETDKTALCLDVLSGYPRPLGVEIAARTLNAQVMICDEIGDLDEAAALASAQNCGVPLVATAHASNVSELLRRSGLKLLHRAGVFGAYAGIRRDGCGGFLYEITDWEAAEHGI
jgi:stage III sporulation protein AA